MAKSRKCRKPEILWLVSCTNEKLNLEFYPSENFFELKKRVFVWIHVVIYLDLHPGWQHWQRRHWHAGDPCPLPGPELRIDNCADVSPPLRQLPQELKRITNVQCKKPDRHCRKKTCSKYDTQKPNQLQGRKRNKRNWKASMERKQRRRPNNSTYYVES